jgi:hypothetical protein
VSCKEKEKGDVALHDDAASAGLLRSVGVVTLVDLEEWVRIGNVERVLWLLTVPQRLGTMKSLGSLSVKAIRLRVACQHVYWVPQREARTHSMEASETGILLRLRSSCSLWLSSLRRRSFNSAMLCFLLLPVSVLRISYGADMVKATTEGWSD